MALIDAAKADDFAYTQIGTLGLGRNDDHGPYDCGTDGDFRRKIGDRAVLHEPNGLHSSLLIALSQQTFEHFIIEQ